MTPLDVRKVVESTVEPLGDIARERTWQRLEAGLAAPPAMPPRRSPVAARIVLGLIAAAALIAIVLGTTGRRATAPAPTARARFVLSAGARVEHQWAGGVLTIVGPGEVELDAGARVPRLVVHAGAVRVRRAAGAVALELETPDGTSRLTGDDVAVRVIGQATELGSGAARADAVIERHLAELVTAPIVVAPAAPVAPVAPVLPAAPPLPARLAPAPRRAASPAGDEDVTDAAVAAAAAIDAGAAGAAVAPEVAPETLADVYLRAEAALRRGDRTIAALLLTRIVDEDPTGRLAAAARYDLALLAFERGDHGAALRLIDALLAVPADPNLDHPARVLRCRVLRAQGGRCSTPE